jgi:hypothetical protein
MKLQLALVAAFAEAQDSQFKGEADGPKKGIKDGKGEKPKNSGPPIVHCSQQSGPETDYAYYYSSAYVDYAVSDFSSSSPNHGLFGSVSLADYVNELYCYIDFGSECDGEGVDIEFTKMAIEASSWAFDGVSWFKEDGCKYDSIKFMYTDANGDTQYTADDCGIFNGGAWDLASYYHQTPAKTKLSLVGTDMKMILDTDYSIKGGFVDFNWQCRSYGNDICPSKFDGSADSGCYTQSSPWQPGKDVTCSMDNTECLTTTCLADGISTFFRGDLFHVNSKHEGTFMEQLQQGIRVLKRKDTGDVLQDVMDPNNIGATCGYHIVDGGVQLNWNYAQCGIAPTMKNGMISYGITIQAFGNDADSDPMIEFYVDFDASAECLYDPEIDIDPVGFYVNQEDVDAEISKYGELKKNFDCVFFEDSKAKNQIMDHNIVNMGERIYGRLRSKGNAGYGLIYKLQRVTFTDASGKTGTPPASFNVIGGGKGSKVVQAKVQKSKYIPKKKYWRPMGEKMKFSFLSFGFENLDEQNPVDVKCHIKVNIDPNFASPSLGRSRAGPPAMLDDEDDEYDSAEWGVYDYYDEES